MEMRLKATKGDTCAPGGNRHVKSSNTSSERRHPAWALRSEWRLHTPLRRASSALSSQAFVPAVTQGILGIYLKKMKTFVYKVLYKSTSSSFIRINQKNF